MAQGVRAMWQKQSGTAFGWDATFRNGQWDYLASLGEMPRYALIAGYIRHFARTGAVLDAGCGQGILFEHLDDRSVAYSGFDVSATAIAEARRRAPGARLSVCSADEYQPDGRFDVVVFNEVLPHVDDPLGTLDRFIHFLNPQGLVILSLYQSRDQQAKAVVLTGMLENEIAIGRYAVLAKSTVENEAELKWTIYCLR